jgi:uncharacterized protein (TIGR00369 family)
MGPDEGEFETAEALLRRPPFHKYLGLELEAMDDERVVVRMEHKEELVGNPTIPSIHGGILAALVDLAGGAATFHALGIPTPTVDLQIDYIRPAIAEDGRAHLAEAEIVNIGDTVAFVDVEVRDEQEEKLVAKGRCVYSTKGQEEGVPEEDRHPIG